MTTTETIILGVCIVAGACAILCYATTWAEPREDDAPPAPARDLVDFDEERL